MHESLWLVPQLYPSYVVDMFGSTVKKVYEEKLIILFVNFKMSLFVGSFGLACLRSGVGGENA